MQTISKSTHSDSRELLLCTLHSKSCIPTKPLLPKMLWRNVFLEFGKSNRFLISYNTSNSHAKSDECNRQLSNFLGFVSFCVQPIVPSAITDFAGKKCCNVNLLQTQIGYPIRSEQTRALSYVFSFETMAHFDKKARKCGRLHEMIFHRNNCNRFSYPNPNAVAHLDNSPLEQMILFGRIQLRWHSFCYFDSLEQTIRSNEVQSIYRDWEFVHRWKGQISAQIEQCVKAEMYRVIRHKKFIWIA